VTVLMLKGQNLADND